MQDWVKFVIGGAATSLLAWGAHSIGGEAFAEDLDANSAAALAEAGIDNVSVDLTREPSIKRVAILDGEVDDAAKSEALKIVRSVPGVADARWAGDEDVALAGEADEAASPEVVQCQDAVDSAVGDRTLNFRSGSAYLSAASLAIIADVAKAMTDCKDLKIAVGGHSDKSGREELNLSMSQERAERVAGALAERGVGADRVSAKGFGSSQLLLPDDATNPANRRIEFTVSDGGSAATGEGE